MRNSKIGSIFLTTLYLCASTILTSITAITAITAITTEAFAADARLPKTIAPDLIVESVEQGEFLDNPADPRHFKPSHIVGKKSGLYGWRYGYLFSATDITQGVPAGKYSSTLYVEHIPVKTFTITVQ